MEFFSESYCGKAFLRLIARGSTIVAELLRLSNNIPKVFFPNSPDHKKYKGLLFDFNYLRNIEEYDEKVTHLPNYETLEENIFDQYSDIIERFMRLFESINRYTDDINTLVNEIEEGFYVESMDDLLSMEHGKQVLAETFYYLGVMLILLENLIPGPVREQIVTLHVRIMGGQNAVENIHEICRLSKKTGFIPMWFTDGDSQVKSTFLNEVSSKVNPEAIKKAKMREIVDKHFYDNWVIPVFLGYLVDLTYEWMLYPSARKAITNTVSEENIKELSQKYRIIARDTVKKLYYEVLMEGYLTKIFVLKELNMLMGLLRDANTSCRWLMLHRLSRRPQMKEIVLKAAKIQSILKLLLYTAQYEQIIELFVVELLKQKDHYWNGDKEAAEDNMNDLSNLFSGETKFKLIKPNEQYSEWFSSMEEKIGNLDPEEQSGSSKKIQQYIRALQEIEKYDQIDNNLQVRQYLADTRKHLRKMMKVLNLKNRLVSEIRQITDVSYCSLLLKEYVSHMQDVIQEDAKKTLMLRSTFLKLSSIMNAPMNRLMQLSLLPEEEKEAKTDEERKSVSMYYSAELMKFVKEVLQIIPRRVFGVSSKLASVLTPKIKQMPGEIDHKELREYALFENRLKIAKYAREIAVYTDGIMSMDRYIIGMIEVVPMKILEEGLRKELLIMLGEKLDRRMRFTDCKKYSQFEVLLSEVGDELDSLKRAVEYIQDMLNIYGLKIWYDEYNKLISVLVDVEWNYIRSEELPDEALKWASSENQNDSSREITGVSTRNLKKSENSLTFCGRLINAIVRFCDHRKTTYIPKTLSFYAANTTNVLITMNTFLRIRKCIGVNGLHGLDKLLSFMTLSELYSIQDSMKKIVRADKTNLKNEGSKFGMLNHIMKDADFVYQNAKKRLGIHLDKLMVSLEKVGLYYILRTMILRELNISARNNSQKIYMLLETLNESLVNEVQNGRYDNLHREELEAESTFLNQLAEVSVRLGFADPLTKVYFKPQMIESIPLLMSYVLYNSIEYTRYNKKISMVESDPKSPQRHDPVRMIYGMAIFLNQYNEKTNHLINQFIGHYIKSVLATEGEVSPKEFSHYCFNAHIMCQFHIEFIRLLDLNMATSEHMVPSSLVNKISMLASRAKRAR